MILKNNELFAKLVDNLKNSPFNAITFAYLFGFFLFYLLFYLGSILKALPFYNR